LPPQIISHVRRARPNEHQPDGQIRSARVVVIIDRSGAQEALQLVQRVQHDRVLAVLDGNTSSVSSWNAASWPAARRRATVPFATTRPMPRDRAIITLSAERAASS
jgi:hypothetical protein